MNELNQQWFDNEKATKLIPFKVEIEQSIEFGRLEWYVWKRVRNDVAERIMKQPQYQETLAKFQSSATRREENGRFSRKESTY